MVVINKRLLMVGCGRSNGFSGTCNIAGTLCGSCQHTLDTCGDQVLLNEHQQVLGVVLRAYQEGDLAVLREIGDLDGLLSEFP